MDNDNAWKQEQIAAERAAGWQAVDMIWFTGGWWFVLDTGVIYQRDADGVRLYTKDRSAHDASTH